MGTIASWDLDLVRLAQDARFPALTAVMTLMSMWWVKSLVLVGIGLVADVRRPVRVPLGATAGVIAYVVADVVAQALKNLTDRRRPPLVDHRIVAEVALPHSSAMPSAHAATALAAAVGVGMVHPRLRPPLLALAALVALSRVYLGVHFPTDVIVGALIGIAAGLPAGWLAQALLARLATSPPRRGWRAPRARGPRGTEGGRGAQP